MTARLSHVSLCNDVKQVLGAIFTSLFLPSKTSRKHIPFSLSLSLALNELARFQAGNALQLNVFIVWRFLKLTKRNQSLSRQWNT